MNTQSIPQIFDKKLLQARTKKIDAGNFLLKEIHAMLDERVIEINREFGSSLTFQRDAEYLQGEENSFDIIKSSLAVHWVNDVVGLFLSAKKLLREDGFFISNFFGGETLKELRQVFAEADKNTISPRISPFIDVRDAGMLLQRAGFALPVVDSDRIEVTYSDIYALMKHLKLMGENNALVKRRRNFTGKNFMQRADNIYKERFSDEDGRIVASFEVITISGYKPAASQQKPLKPGSGKISLKDVL